MKTTKKNTSKSAAKTTSLKRVFKYETTFPRLTVADNKEITKLLKTESKEVNDRFTERKIKITDIVKISKYGHKQLLNGKVKSNSMKFYLTLKNGKKLCMNFSDYQSKKK